MNLASAPHGLRAGDVLRPRARAVRARAGQGDHQDRHPEPALGRPGRARRGHQARRPARRREVQGQPREDGLQGRASCPSTTRPSPTSASPTPRTSSPTRTSSAVIGHLNSGVAIPSSEVYKEVNAGDDLAREHQPRRHRPRLREREPRVRARRRAGRGGLGVRARHAQGQERLHRPRQDPYGQSIAEFFKADAEKKGIKVVGFEGTEEKSNFDPILTPIKAKNPDLIYFGGIYDQARAVLQAGAREGHQGQVHGPGRHGLVRPDEDRRQGGGRHVLHLGGRPGLGAARRRRHSSTSSRRSSARTPSRIAAEAYDAATIALQAIEAAAKGGKVPSREDVSAAVREGQATPGSPATSSSTPRATARRRLLRPPGRQRRPGEVGRQQDVKQLTIAAPAAKK